MDKGTDNGWKVDDRLAGIRTVLRNDQATKSFDEVVQSKPQQEVYKPKQKREIGVKAQEQASKSCVQTRHLPAKLITYRIDPVLNSSPFSRTSKRCSSPKKRPSNLPCHPNCLLNKNPKLTHTFEIPNSKSLSTSLKWKLEVSGGSSLVRGWMMR